MAKRTASAKESTPALAPRQFNRKRDALQSVAEFGYGGPLLLVIRKSGLAACARSTKSLTLSKRLSVPVYRYPRMGRGGTAKLHLSRQVQRLPEVPRTGGGEYVQQNLYDLRSSATSAQLSAATQ